MALGQWRRTWDRDIRAGPLQNQHLSSYRFLIPLRYTADLQMACAGLGCRASQRIPRFVKTRLLGGGGGISSVVAGFLVPGLLNFPM